MKNETVQASRKTDSLFIHLFLGYCDQLFHHLARRYPGRRVVVVTDPPYNIRFLGYDTYGDDLSDEAYIRLISTFKDLPAVFLHYPYGMDRWLVPALGPRQNNAVWCYNFYRPRGHRDIGFFNLEPDFRQVRTTGKYVKAKTFVNDWWCDIPDLKSTFRERRDSPHPCPVPVALMERILAVCAHKGDLICDPFAGSLTTAIAAHRMGLDFIGIELSREYLRYGVQRIQSEFGFTPEIWKEDDVLVAA